MKKIISTIAAFVALQFYCEAQNTFPLEKPVNQSKHFANKSLSNLIAPTSVNVDLLPGTNAVRNLGSLSKKWKGLYLSGSLISGGVAIGGNLTPLTNGLYVSGNTGLGTRSPSRKLHVVGTSLFTANLKVSDGGILANNTSGDGVTV